MPETLADQPVEIIADLHLDSYYGDEDETEALYFSQTKYGTHDDRGVGDLMEEIDHLFVHSTADANVQS